MPGDGKQQMVYSLQTQGRVNEVDEFKNIIVRTAEEGGLVQLKDIARIEIGEENYRATSKYNGVPNVAIAVNIVKPVIHKSIFSVMFRRNHYSYKA